ncbi:N-acyl amino acid synthase FeeM domain-containing protein [Pseudoduganella namucuonensis]|uniref:N-acyl amino acid synthase FeeM catalytic core domain-containing protein n=1 Tax=Pseudoduganella namucuonensis TaxID=1035707 RepID=A0A1I7GGE9_9BURK|nr:N-acetyltransferase [Pseudoduganella namucuonensis]SFU47498.1 hypothetical protein SAMN05216552_1003302 [Pseudoduganella namucuonensis]
MADTEEGRQSASVLINRMYTWRGYRGNHRVDDHPQRITLSASDHGDTVGTVTLGLDGPSGLLADDVYQDVVDVFRMRGGNVCEITKLAMGSSGNSKKTLAALFHVLFMYARHLHRCTDVFIEVNPRHRRYYETMLGFEQLAGVRDNPRVHAPSYLLWTSLDQIARRIDRLAGTAAHGNQERSLYPYFFSPHEANGIMQRLIAIE